MPRDASTMVIDFPWVEVLSAEAEVVLARRIEAGVYASWLLERDSHERCEASERELTVIIGDGVKAQQELFAANLRMVAMIATRWGRRYGLEYDELFQEGCLGLGEAIRRYDYMLGVRFGTLAWKWITNRVAQAAQCRCGQIEGPLWRLRARQKLLAVAGKLAGEWARTPTVAEIAQVVGRSRSWVMEILTSSRRINLDDCDGLVVVSVSDDESETAACAYLASLSRLEQTVIKARNGFWGKAATTKQVACELGLSESTVRRIETRAYTKLRSLLERDEKVA